jgi:hypothetical protein
MDPTNAELDAATKAYVAARWPHVKDWRAVYPQQWQETRDRIRLALQAAAKVREAQI